MILLKTLSICIPALLFSIFLTVVVAQDDGEIEGRVKTQYDANGRPVNQSEEAKGLHYVTGSATLSSGRATININTSIADGKQDVSFISASTYRGSAWSTDTSNVNVYKVVPLKGTQCLIMSDSTSDNSTVYFRLVGE